VWYSKLDRKFEEQKNKLRDKFEIFLPAVIVLSENHPKYLTTKRAPNYRSFAAKLDCSKRS